MNATVLHGTVRGRTIDLEIESGLPDGLPVHVTVVPANANGAPNLTDARLRLTRAAGGWANDGAELDRFLEWNRQQRQVRRPEMPE